MEKLMNLLMLSCKKAGELMEKRYFKKLSMRERIMLKVHLKVCKVCATYEKQSTLLDTLLLNHLRKIKLQSIVNDNLKEKIRKKLFSK